MHYPRHEFPIKEMDFVRAGEASLQVKKILREMKAENDLVRRATIACYEAEINAVVYGRDGVMSLEVDDEGIYIYVEDKGDGIPDIEQAMMEGFSTATEEIREMGFGAGMGLPNIMKNADEFTISSAVGEGTRLKIIFRSGWTTEEA
ncbi:MAG: ATP-binding protein [Deltaproteobacteria bacterium]|nr:ATP-binding protein [Deltaproteobacteria bacterium]MBW2050622.1 ATP-binding protein [Deltaproteobacteria bacterium]MBW2139484.1 ATP-binding protein [Deltaproteobacteria bacterium]MBW2322567.1 ATP-binding protein [Deltaproteobacteria bacterium]